MYQRKRSGNPDKATAGETTAGGQRCTIASSLEKLPSRAADRLLRTLNRASCAWIGAFGTDRHLGARFNSGPDGNGLRRDLASIENYDRQLNDKVSFVLGAVLDFTDIEHNDGVKVRTIASVVGRPPTFVAGAFGMNVKNMPELFRTYGYEFGCAVIVVSTLTPRASPGSSPLSCRSRTA